MKMRLQGAGKLFDAVHGNLQIFQRVGVGQAEVPLAEGPESGAPGGDHPCFLQQSVADLALQAQGGDIEEGVEGTIGQTTGEAGNVVEGGHQPVPAKVLEKSSRMIARSLKPGREAMEQAFPSKTSRP